MGAEEGTGTRGSERGVGGRGREQALSLTGIGTQGKVERSIATLEMKIRPRLRHTAAMGVPPGTLAAIAVVAPNRHARGGGGGCHGAVKAGPIECSRVRHRHEHRVWE